MADKKLIELVQNALDESKKLDRKFKQNIDLVIKSRPILNLSKLDQIFISSINCHITICKQNYVFLNSL